MAQEIVPAAHPWPAATADAEDCVQVQFGSGILRLAYKDMSGASRKVEFRGVVGVRWTLETADNFAGLRDDLVYEVLDSEWVRGINAVNVLADKPDLRHYVIGFNEESWWLKGGVRVMGGGRVTQGAWAGSNWPLQRTGQVRSGRR